MKTILTALAAAAIVAAVGSEASATARPLIAPPKICSPSFTGPKVTIPWKGGKKSFRHYRSAVWSYSCSAAIGYTKKFYRRRSAGAETTLSGGPAGYVCRSLAPKGYTVFQGSCKKKHSAKFNGFVWSLKGS